MAAETNFVMSISEIEAIDVHAHYGVYRRGQNELLDAWVSADAQEVVARAIAARTRLTVVSPLLGLLPRGEADATVGNDEATEIVRTTDELLQWVIVNPLQPQSYEQAAELLQQSSCVGIKLHPEEHRYPIAEHGAKLFEFAAEHDAVVLAHSGDPNSWPADFLPWIDRYPNVRLILAHLGNGGGAAGDPTLQVRAIQQSRHGNIFTDTSSARSILPNLIEWAVGEIGAERILYGTDSPLYCASMHRARIDHADISDTDKRLILTTNAEQLLELKAC